MGELGERAIDLAAERVERERLAGVERIQAGLRGVSDRLICDCGEPISEARRQAAPFTDKCIDCATFAERQQRRRA